MRKSFILGLLALLFGFLSNTALAGNVQECEFLKDGHTKGLYGLCTAYANAGNEYARNRIWDKFEALRRDDEQTLEQIFDPPVAAPAVVCPCWTPESLASTVAGLFDSGFLVLACEVDDAGDAADAMAFMGLDGFPEFGAGYTRYFSQSPDVTECFLDLPSGAVMFVTEPAEDQLCRNDVRAVQSAIGCP
jgi:hypothetical protein